MRAVVSFFVRLIVALSFCSTFIILSESYGAQQARDIGCTPQTVACYQDHRIEDAQVQHLAVQTMANMADNLVNIGLDPHNPHVVGSSVVNIIGSFVHFVVTAMRHPEIIEQVQNEELEKIIRGYIACAYDKESSKHCSQELIKEGETDEKCD